MQLRRNYFTMNNEARARELEIDARENHDAGFAMFASIAAQEAAICRAKSKKAA